VENSCLYSAVNKPVCRLLLIEAAGNQVAGQPGTQSAAPSPIYALVSEVRFVEPGALTKNLFSKRGRH
jgi:hypothetical protein